MVGRDGEAPIRFDSETVSPRHAMLRVGDTQVDVIDLGSDGGTALNDRPVHGLVRGATSGDRLRFGTVQCELHGPAPQERCAHGTPTQEVDTRAVLARVALVRAHVGPPGARGAAAPVLLAPGRAQPRLVLCVRDQTWAWHIEESAAIHTDLRVELLPPALVDWAARRPGPAVLLLDMDLAASLTRRLVTEWCAGQDRPERTVLLTGDPGAGRDAPHALALGAKAWITAGRSPSLVIALARTLLGVHATRPGLPAGGAPYSSR